MNVRPQEIIAKKRDGGELSEEEIGSFIDGTCDNSWADYQISALVMAMFIRGMSQAEQDAITEAMLHSGEVLDFSDIDKPKADKHSTGGVGDKTSLIIAPLLAACGVAVPMISGRGLGHTGGTLDKLESIPGYNVDLSTKQFRQIISDCGFAMAGQTSEIVPADKKLYALRDATATVPYIPLIVASIMSKKLAEGLDALVLDVKTGAGAFMREFADSKRLAEALVATGEKFGVKTRAVVSDMNQPLGKFVGNALEVYECVCIMRGEMEHAATPTWELSLELSAQVLVLTGTAVDLQTARELASTKLSSGEVLEKFRQNVELQGGDPKICDDPEVLLNQNIQPIQIKAGESGYVAEIDALGIGSSIVEIGGGRTKAEDKIDTCVGYALKAKIGDEVRKGDLLGLLFCRNTQQADSVSQKLQNSYKIGGEKPESKKLILASI